MEGQDAMPPTSRSLTIGVAPPFAGPWATPDNQLRVATRAEELGYGSLWTLSRLLFPVGPDGEGDQDHFGQVFRQVCEPLVTLAFLAAHTSRIRLGISALVAPFYSPAVLAKQLIALDRVSGGRLDAGVAQGWSAEEFEAVGVPFERRLGRTLEYVSVLREMWEKEIAAFEGEFTRLPRSLVRPRPVQPTLPLLLGGSGDKAWRRAGRIAQGWVGPAFITREEVAAASRMVREGAESAGRDPGAARIVVRAAAFVRPEGQHDRQLFNGSLPEIAADMAEMRDLGATEVFADFNFDYEVVGPHTDPAVSMDLMEHALEVLAPRERTSAAA
jgi:probable F420-dependent oxidoreductase